MDSTVAERLIAYDDIESDRPNGRGVEKARSHRLTSVYSCSELAISLADDCGYGCIKLATVATIVLIRAPAQRAEKSPVSATPCARGAQLAPQQTAPYYVHESAAERGARQPETSPAAARGAYL